MFKFNELHYFEIDCYWSVTSIQWTFYSQVKLIFHILTLCWIKLGVVISSIESSCFSKSWESHCKPHFVLMHSLSIVIGYILFVRWNCYSCDIKLTTILFNLHHHRMNTVLGSILTQLVHSLLKDPSLSLSAPAMPICSSFYWPQKSILALALMPLEDPLLVKFQKVAEEVAINNHCSLKVTLKRHWILEVRITTTLGDIQRLRMPYPLLPVNGLKKRHGWPMKKIWMTFLPAIT